MQDIDIAIVGGGPAGLQAALVLARTRKSVVVFDGPGAPRNAASHGVHNFLGLDGLLPLEIRQQAWHQIDVYDSAELVRQMITDIQREEPTEVAAPATGFLLTAASGDIWRARHVILTCGYRDLLPDIDGFEACWADTIIPCPFCDGYENRDRVWGIVPASGHELDVFPAMVKNWTGERVVLAPSSCDVSDAQRHELERLGVDLHIGDIVALSHQQGKLTSVTLDSGATIEVGTLLCTPAEEPAPLISSLVDSVGLELDDNGYVKVDEFQRTNVDGLWAAGDVQGWMGAIESANAGGMAAFMIVHGWFAAAA